MHGNAQPDGRQLGGSEPRSYFSPLVDQSNRIKSACAGVSVACNDVFRLTISCCVPEIFVIKSRSCAKLCQNFYVFGPPNFKGKGPLKFLTNFYKYGSPSNMWQSLVTIGQATSEIRGQKRRKRSKLQR